MTSIILIAAVGQNRIIGHHNRLPWHLAEDLKHFKALTMGKVVLMGRKTFESLPARLPGRQHWVISRDPHWHAPGAVVFRSLESAINAADAVLQLFVIGGGEVYRQTLPLAHTLYLTEVALSPVGDTFFPVVSPEEWEESSRECLRDASGIQFDFVTYRRRRPSQSAL